MLSATPAARPGMLRQRWRLAAALSIPPLFLFLLLTAGYNAGLAPAVRTPDVDATTTTSSNKIVNSVIVPSYHEAPNLTPLVTRIFKASAAPDTTEVVIVDDDSRDGTIDAVEELRREGYNVQLIVRTDESGLSSAVLRGFKEANGSKFVVMDADLQHPPETVPALFEAMNERTPFVMGTRYGPGGGVDKDWPLYRRVMSAVARSLAAPLTSTTDPMSGFFGLTRDLYAQSARVNPVGFKIALELLLKTGVLRDGVAEVSYSFSKRTVGASKLSSKVILRYVFHLAALYRWRMGFLGLVLLELALVGAFWLLLLALEVAADQMRKRKRQDFRRREKFKLDV
ncbi:nucleotide-diphospho-sugar transferase [Auriculariales sp. MPI-PUGE-AT-0066]|nr:nucleotide-diphospho-sugar transferase [Auriculariales sp. MPI-PUGE-AT-0066]